MSKGDLWSEEGKRAKGRRGVYMRHHPAPSWRDKYGSPPRGDPNRPMQRYDAIGRLMHPRGVRQETDDAD